MMVSIDCINYTAPSEEESLMQLILSDGTLAEFEFGWLTIKGTRAKLPSDLPDGGFCLTLEEFPV